MTILLWLYLKLIFVQNDLSWNFCKDPIRMHRLAKADSGKQMNFLLSILNFKWNEGATTVLGKNNCLWGACPNFKKNFLDELIHVSKEAVITVVVFRHCVLTTAAVGLSSHPCKACKFPLAENSHLYTEPISFSKKKTEFQEKAVQIY